MKALLDAKDGELAQAIEDEAVRADAAEKAYRFNHNKVLNDEDKVTPASLFIGAPDLPYII